MENKQLWNKYMSVGLYGKESTIQLFKKVSKQMSNMWWFFVGLVLHLQRSECVAVARNANVPQVLHDISFKRAAIGNQHDEDQWELHSNDDESFMGFNDNSEIKNAKTDKNIAIGKDDDTDENNGMYDNNSNQSVSSDDDSFHEEMDWYHVLENHDNYTRKKKKKQFLGKELKSISFKE